MSVNPSTALWIRAVQGLITTMTKIAQTISATTSNVNVSLTVCFVGKMAQWILESS